MQWSPAVRVNDSRQLFREVMTEAKKITWPTLKEAVAGTVGVVVVVTIITIVLSIVDAILGQSIQWLLPG